MYQSCTSFYSYHTGEVPAVKRIETDYELPVLGFKNSIAVVMPKERPPKTVVLQMDSVSGKKYIMVKGKKVEVKVKTNSPQSAKQVRRTRDVETSTNDLYEQTSVAVQTDEKQTPEEVLKQKTRTPVRATTIEYEMCEEDDGLIIREDVKMGQGPKCPTPRNNYYDMFDNLAFSIAPISPFLNMNRKTREQQILQCIMQDFEGCEAYDHSGNMPIHCAVIENNLDLVRRQCIALKYKGVSINTTNYSTLTPLQLAIFHEADYKIFDVLLQYGADRSVIDVDGNTVIHLAVLSTNEQIFQRLLTGVDVSSLHTFNYEGLTPLMLCCCNNKLKAASLLLNLGVDPNTRDQKSGRTALFHAVESNNVEIVRLLLQYRADPKAKNFMGMSPHDAIFEIEEIDKRIALMVLGKDHAVPGKQNKGKVKRKAADDKEENREKGKVKLVVERHYRKCSIRGTPLALNSKE